MAKGSAGISFVLAAFVFAQKLGNYENKPLAVVLSIGALGCLIWWAVAHWKEGTTKLGESNENPSRVYAWRAVGLVFAAAIIGAVIFGNSKQLEIAKSNPVAPLGPDGPRSTTLPSENPIPVPAKPDGKTAGPVARLEPPTNLNLYRLAL